MKKLYIIFLVLFLTLSLSGQGVMMGVVGSKPASGNTPTGNVAPEFLSTDGNTVGWYIAAYSASITKDGSNYVSSWTDTLGSGHNLTESTNKPLWVSPNIIRFDGSNDKLTTATFTWNDPQFIYIVLKQVSWAGNDPILDGYTNETGQLFQFGSSPQMQVKIGGNYLGAYNLTDAGVGSYVIVRLSYVNLLSSMQIDEHALVQDTEYNAAHMAGLTLGTGLDGDYGNFEVKEIICRKITDTGSNQTLVMTYLKKRYGL